MAKKRQEPDLFETLRASGLRKRVARTLSEARGGSKNSRVPKRAQKALSDLQAVVSTVEDRVGGGPAKRKAATKKAQATRKRNQVKRSQAAKKGAQTRKKNKKSGSLVGAVLKGD